MKLGVHHFVGFRRFRKLLVQLYSCSNCVRRSRIHIFSCIINLRDMVLRCRLHFDQSRSQGQNQQKGDHALNLFACLLACFSNFGSTLAETMTSTMTGDYNCGQGVDGEVDSAWSYYRPQWKYSLHRFRIQSTKYEIVKDMVNASAPAKMPSLIMGTITRSMPGTELLQVMAAFAGVRIRLRTFRINTGDHIWRTKKCAPAAW